MDFMNESMRSDLVIEYAEHFYNSSEQDGRQLPGVEFDEGVESEHRIKVTDVKIVDEEGEKVIGKPMGRYITVEAVHLPDRDDDYHQAATRGVDASAAKTAAGFQRQKSACGGHW